MSIESAMSGRQAPAGGEKARGGAALAAEAPGAGSEPDPSRSVYWCPTARDAEEAARFLRDHPGAALPVGGDPLGR